MAVPDLLGDPESQLTSEISFRRLLRKLQGQDVTHGVSSQKLRCYVETLQEQLSDMKRTTVASKSMDAYQQAVTNISAQFVSTQQPAYCRNLLNRPPPQPYGSVTPIRATPTRTAAQQQALLRSTRTPGFGSDNTPATQALTDSTRQRLEQQGRMQEQLTDEMVDMVGALKAQTAGMRDAVQARDRVMDETEASLQSSAAAAKISAVRAGQQVKRSSWSFCYNIIILLVVLGVLVAMVVYIKATHVMGYRAGRVEL